MNVDLIVHLMHFASNEKYFVRFARIDQSNEIQHQKSQLTRYIKFQLSLSDRELKFCHFVSFFNDLMSITLKFRQKRRLKQTFAKRDNA